MKQQKNNLFTTLGLEKANNLIRLDVYLKSHAKKDEILGFHQEHFLKINVTAPAVNNKANQALIKLLAKKLNLSTSQIRIIRGEKSRYKVLEICNLK